MCLVTIFGTDTIFYYNTIFSTDTVNAFLHGNHSPQRLLSDSGLPAEPQEQFDAPGCVIGFFLLQDAHGGHSVSGK